MVIPQRVGHGGEGGGGKFGCIVAPGRRNGNTVNSPIGPALRMAALSLLYQLAPLKSTNPRSAHFMTYWQDKVCVISGGSAGLGLSIGRALAQRGARVVLTARRQDVSTPPWRNSAPPAARSSASPATWPGRKTSTASPSRSLEQFGRVDMLCNCAGRSTRGLVLDTTPEDFQQLLEVNFMTTVRATRAFAPRCSPAAAIS